MSEPKIDDVVARQYTRWIYPAPIPDLVEWSAGGMRQGADPSVQADIYWPRHGYREGLDILVAGCGANQAPAVSLHNPTARVVGIDISEASLAHSAYLKDRHRLDNLRLELLPIEQAGKLGGGFDCIISTGVIHHLDDPDAGVRALGQLLRRDGVMALMLYGRYGRTGVYMLQDLFRLLGLRQEPEDVEFVRQTLSAISRRHPVLSYISPGTGAARDMQFDGGVVDTFLHRRDRSYTVGDCLRLAEDNDLAFQGWMENAVYHPDLRVSADHPLCKRLAGLDDRTVWQAMELFTATLSVHNIMLCRKDRPPGDYVIDFAASNAGDYVPAFRRGTQIEPAGPVRPGAAIARAGSPSLQVHETIAPMLALVDGKRSISAIADGLAGRDRATARAQTIRLCRTLWRAGLIAVRLPSTNPPP